MPKVEERGRREVKSHVQYRLGDYPAKLEIKQALQSQLGAVSAIHLLISAQ